MAKKTIGTGAENPKIKCDDQHCPFHAELSVRGREFKGKIVSNIFQKTATVEWSRKKFVPKYERYEKRRTRVKVHAIPCIEVKQGDTVRIMESRPISKTKKFIIIEKIEDKQTKK